MTLGPPWGWGWRGEMCGVRWCEVGGSRGPHLMTVGTQRMSCCAEVKGAAMEASASDREIPAIAAFKACTE